MEFHQRPLTDFDNPSYRTVVRYHIPAIAAFLGTPYFIVAGGAAVGTILSGTYNDIDVYLPETAMRRIWPRIAADVVVADYCVYHRNKRWQFIPVQDNSFTTEGVLKEFDLTIAMAAIDPIARSISYHASLEAAIFGFRPFGYLMTTTSNKAQFALTLSRAAKYTKRYKKILDPLNILLGAPQEVFDAASFTEFRRILVEEISEDDVAGYKKNSVLERLLATVEIPKPKESVVELF